MSPAVRVDDTDTNIRYSGSWIPITATSDYDNLGNFGQPFRNTLHSTNSSAGFAYNFTGRSVLIAGTMSSTVITSPSFSCSIDSEVFQYISMFNSSNGVTLCKVDNLSEGPHTLELNAEPSSDGSLLFDYIQYVPLSDFATADYATVVIQYGDPRLHSAYDEYWYTGSPKISSSGTQSIGAVTQTTNSTFVFPFNGTGLSWFGFYDRGYPSIDTTATYSIDDQLPIQFLLSGVSNSSQFGQMFFQTDQLPQKQHKIIVRYKGNNETTPLTLENLVVENGPIARKQLQQIPTSSSAPTTITQHSSLNPNAIVGGVIGGIAIVLFAVFAFLLLRIRGASRKHTPASTEFTTQPIPYTPPSGPIIRAPSMHKQKPPPARYMPPLSTAGSMRSYDPPSTAVPSLPERRSPSRHYQRDSTANILGSHRQTLPKARSTGSSQNYISLNALYSQDNSGDHNLDLLPKPPTSSATSSSILR